MSDARIALARISAHSGHDLPAMLHQVASVAAHALAVDRVSVWRVGDGGRQIHCDYVYEAGRPDVFGGTVLSAQDFPNYFTAIQTHRVVPVSNVSNTSVTEEFRAPYLTPLGITAMLDAPLYQEGVLAGVVCHEHKGGPRDWTAAECDCAAAVADAVSRLYEEVRRMDAESKMRTYHDRIVEMRHLGEIGRLALGMAHDFGNILQTIAGNIELLRHEGGGAGSPRLDTMAHATAKGEALARQLMQLGRSETRPPSVLDMCELIQRDAAIVRMAAGPHTDVDISLASEVSRVFVDSAEIERVILNLVVNARDAMPAGGRLCVSVSESSGPWSNGRQGTFVVIEVRDSGIGMDAATLARIFEPFFTTKGPAGSGLGLSIVYHALEAAGGFVVVESVPGSGTSVRVCLPAMAAPARS